MCGPSGAWAEHPEVRRPIWAGEPDTGRFKKPGWPPQATEVALPAR